LAGQERAVTQDTSRGDSHDIPDKPELAKRDSDGPYCYYLQRRVSALFSRVLARHLKPNTVTGLDLLMGLLAAWFLWRGHWLSGIAMIQLFGVFSCVDGEVARLRQESSSLGDFFDTLTDRITELMVILALTCFLATKLSVQQAWPAGLGLLGGVWLLTLSSEKFRSAYRMNYPKRRLEPVFAFVCAGSDVRLLVLSIGVVAAALSHDATILLWTFWGLAAVTCINFVVRVVQIARHFGTCAGSIRP
jgi:phosphatidylglycerophosphate synthase